MPAVLAILFPFVSVCVAVLLMDADIILDPASHTGASAVFAHGIVEIAREHRWLVGLFVVLSGLVVSWAFFAAAVSGSARDRGKREPTERLRRE